MTTSKRSFAEVVRSPWSDLAELRAYLKQHATLATLMLGVTIFSALAIGPLEVLVPLFASRSLALSSAVAGTFMAAGGVGLVIGALAALRVIGRVRSGVWICASGVLGPVVITLMTVSPASLAFVFYLAGGITAGVFSSLSLAAIQEASTAELRGRVLGMFTLVLGAPPAIGGALAGAMSDSIGPGAGLRVFGVVVATLFVLLFVMRPALRAAPESSPSGDGTPAPA